MHSKKKKTKTLSSRLPFPMSAAPQIPLLLAPDSFLSSLVRPPAPHPVPSPASLYIRLFP